MKNIFESLIACVFVAIVYVILSFLITFPIIARFTDFKPNYFVAFVFGFFIGLIRVVYVKYKNK